jgi:hypothetical protein
MAEEAKTLPLYYARVDGRAEGDPLDLVSEELRFSIVRPDATFTGGKGDLRHYVDEIPEHREHRVLGSATTGNIELVVGEIVDNGETVPGPFIALVQLGESGEIRRYLAGRAPESFDLEAL